MLKKILLISLIGLAGCSTDVPRKKTAQPTRFCEKGEVINCRPFLASDIAGGTSRGNREEILE